MEHEAEHAAELTRILWGAEPRYCAWCWREMLWYGEQLRCSEECGGGGHVSDHYITEQRTRADELADAARENHPDLFAIEERRAHDDSLVEGAA
jgi:hypothetical protein